MINQYNDARFNHLYLPFTQKNLSRKNKCKPQFFFPERPRLLKCKQVNLDNDAETIHPPPTSTTGQNDGKQEENDSPVSFRF